MEQQINRVQQEILDMLYNNGHPIERTLQRLLQLTDIDGRERLHDYKGSEIQYSKKQLAQMGYITITMASRRHDLEEGDGLTRLDDDVTFYYFDLDKRLDLTDKGLIWCQRNLTRNSA